MDKNKKTDKVLKELASWPKWKLISSLIESDYSINEAVYKLVDKFKKDQR